MTRRKTDWPSRAGQARDCEDGDERQRCPFPVLAGAGDGGEALLELSFVIYDANHVYFSLWLRMRRSS
jgi:hypothetical protein